MRTWLTKRVIVALALGLLLLILTARHLRPVSPKNAAGEGKPNIVLILVDDLGFSDIGTYGSEIQTPNLDRLAMEGLRLTGFRNTAKCFPTRASLLTGQYQHSVGMGRKAGHFTNSVTLAEVLKTAGYSTYMVGKHHGKDNPYDRGFDRYYGLKEGAANHFNPGLQRPGEPVPAQKNWPPFDGTRTFCFDSKCFDSWSPPDNNYYSTDTFTDWSIEMLERHEKDKDETPFFMYLSYTAPHDPLQAWPSDIEKYHGQYEQGYEHVAEARYKRQIASGLIAPEHYPRSRPTHQNWDTLSAADKLTQARLMEVYAAMIDRLDQNLGRLFEHLQKTGEIDNTLIMFLSDNGASPVVLDFGDGEIGAVDRWSSQGEHWANVSNVPFRGYKNTSFEGGVVTPFLVKWPGIVPEGGGVRDHTTHVVDIMATILDITGTKYPSQWDGEDIGPLVGESLLPLFRGDSFERNRPLFFEWARGQAIIEGKWKLVRWKTFDERFAKMSPGGWQRNTIATGEWELFDLSVDRTETNDLSEHNPDIVRALTSKYEAWQHSLTPAEKAP